MKKIIITLICIILTTGCYNYTELQNLGIASSILIDYKDKYYITIEVLEEESTKLYKGDGISISEALERASLNAEKKLYYAHLNALILTESVNINDACTFFLRNPDINNTFYVILTEDDNVYEENTDIGKKISNILEENRFNSFFNIIKTIYNKNTDLLLPIISKENGIIKYVAYNNNTKKLTLELNEYDVFNLLDNKNNSYFKTACNNNYFVVNLNKVSTKIKLNTNFQLKIDVEATLSEFNCNLDTTNLKDINTLEELLNQKISLEIENFINRLKENNTDVLGFNEMIQNKYHKIKKDFHYYAFDVEVNSHINKKGLLLK